MIKNLLVFVVILRLTRKRTIVIVTILKDLEKNCLSQKIKFWLSLKNLAKILL